MEPHRNRQKIDHSHLIENVIILSNIKEFSQ